MRPEKSASKGRDGWAQPLPRLRRESRIEMEAEVRPDQRPSTEANPPLPVTIVAHDVGTSGGMERQLGELVTGLLERGHRVTVVARRCELPPHTHLRWIRVRGPARPFALAYPWFFLIGSLLVWRRRQGLLHPTGAG